MVFSHNKALFSWQKFWILGTVALSFVCGKYCPIIDKLGSKDSSCDLQANCVISFCFRLNLIFYTCATRFDVTRNLEFF